MHRHSDRGQTQGDSARSETVVVTGALTYTGKYATRLLLSRGYKIRTLTYHPERANPFGDKVQVFPYNFSDPDQLMQRLVGASTLINTYWVRFPRGTANFESAVQNTRTPSSGMRMLCSTRLDRKAIRSRSW